MRIILSQDAIAKKKEYIAISYVWTQYDTGISCTSFIKLEKYIQQDKEKYVWWDRKSNKDLDEETKQSVIRNMSDIYYNAIEVIAIIPELELAEKITTKMCDINILEEYFSNRQVMQLYQCSRLVKLIKSEWIHRSWTLQEAAVAKRVINLDCAEEINITKIVAFVNILSYLGLRLFEDVILDGDIDNGKPNERNISAEEYNMNIIRLLNLDLSTMYDNSNLKKTIVDYLDKMRHKQLSVISAASMCLNRQMGMLNTGYEPVLGITDGRLAHADDEVPLIIWLDNSQIIDAPANMCWMPNRMLTGLHKYRNIRLGKVMSDMSLKLEEPTLAFSGSRYIAAVIGEADSKEYCTILEVTAKTSTQLYTHRIETVRTVNLNKQAYGIFSKFLNSKYSKDVIVAGNATLTVNNNSIKYTVKNRFKSR